MHATFRSCQSDEDYAKFANYFIRNRKDFHHQFSLSDTLEHILMTSPDSQIILIEDREQKVIGWAHYEYTTNDDEIEAAHETVFVHSVILDKEYRSSWTFIKGFRYMVNQIAEQNRHIGQFQFSALESNVYLNRLYAKFAERTGALEGEYGREFIYSTDFARLYSYLNGMEERTRLGKGGDKHVSTSS
ncbi:GNAT family N-acetyltransferase [Brevibacillus ruminantium]|uniref:GNAT family N-acetyltransferase n=1 Tax=Brevibacillus ruminantium TaxID=2950604 RepID=A0ABY4W7X6_9BACL|nr:GNAT family N-acetyltransferase [Brevibacillus ruminantium]USG63290.1 GNAT family N-acetyltransferase [Brevibacillus ruminantium]